MSAVHSNQIFILSGTTSVPSAIAAVVASPMQSSLESGDARRRFKKSNQQSLCDLIIILITLPTLVVLGLMLESTTRQNWLETTETRLLVLGLGAALAVVCLALCMYVTSRLGKKFLWVGPQYTDDLGPHYSYYNPQAAAAEAADLPPKYDIVMGFDIPPPAYDTLMIDNEKIQYETEKCPKESTIQHI
ncbi:unnamed protein product [Chironomus riparius]|uniref:Uncharacterized protein n=1 Tax=Chironomus riparius TaxID=315576 RepID=A0A9N9RX82_9DIPT|nr:unnamed protein product [Chironomus riparius]